MSYDSTLQPKLIDLFGSGTELSYDKGQIIIRPEDDPSGVFLITEGFVKTYGITKYGNEHLLIIRKAGEFFPLIWAVQSEHRSVYYEAVSDTKLKRISKQTFVEAVDNDIDVTKVMLQQSTEMYRIHSERLYNLQFSSSREKVAYRLLTLAKRFGKDYTLGPGKVIIQIPITHADIANSIGITRETVSRILKRLEKQHIIGYEKPYIVLLEIEDVRKIVY